MHGGAGVSDDVPLAELFARIRTLRIADGPDEVHRALLARLELKKYRPKSVASAWPRKAERNGRGLDAGKRLPQNAKRAPSWISRFGRAAVKPSGWLGETRAVP